MVAEETTKKEKKACYLGYIDDCVMMRNGKAPQCWCLFKNGQTILPDGTVTPSPKDPKDRFLYVNNY